MYISIFRPRRLYSAERFPVSYSPSVSMVWSTAASCSSLERKEKSSPG